MDIEIIKPYGFCNGVKKAINKLDEIISNNIDKQITVIGDLIHNEKVINYYKNKKVRFVNYDSASSYINNVSENEIIVFSTHGHKKEWELSLGLRGIQTHDLTCHNITKNTVLINYFKQNYPIFFICNPEHEESKSISAIPNVYLYDVKNGLSTDLNKNTTIVVTSQTTVKKEDFDKCLKLIQKDYSNVIVNEALCNAVTCRVELIKKEQTPTKVFIVGSKLSSNTERIYNETKTKFPNASSYKINDVSEIDCEFSNNDICLVASGCSASSETVEEIIEYLKKKQF